MGRTSRRRAPAWRNAKDSVAEQTFSHAFRGFTARLTSPQVASLRNDATVLAVVPDEKIFLTAQSYPTGINRVGARSSAAAKIDGVDERIDADVAIVDTGITKVADLNVAGGYNCSTSNRSLWRDAHGHGTHVAGTVGAIDNGSGVVGVAPGVRVWAVKILNDNGEGLLSWYVCGLDWIAAQRDPTDPSLPRFESVNMSVAKSGRDDHACGTVNKDVLHKSICRLVDSGVTVVAAAANDSANASTRIPASYDEVITVSALADTDGKPGGLGGNRCFSWGSYDSDDTFANFSNYGADVDLIAPGKCIWSTLRNGSYGYMSGTSMAAPHVAGAVALLRAGRPYLSPKEVKEALQYLGTLNWKVTSDPDGTHEKLLDVSRLGPRGTFSLAVGSAVTLPEGGGTAAYAVTLTRSATSFERAFLRADDLPPGVRATFEPSTLYGFEGVATTMSLDVPRGVLPGTYPIKVVAAEHGNGASAITTLVVDGRYADGRRPEDRRPAPCRDRRCVRSGPDRLAGRDRPDEPDRGLRAPVAPRWRSVVEPDGIRRLHPAGGQDPGDRSCLPVPGPGARQGRQLERLGGGCQRIECVRPGLVIGRRLHGQLDEAHLSVRLRRYGAIRDRERGESHDDVQRSRHRDRRPDGPDPRLGERLHRRCLRGNDALPGGPGSEPARDVLARLQRTRHAHDRAARHRQWPGGPGHVRHLPLTSCVGSRHAS